MLEPVARTKLSDQVFAQLRDRILADAYRPGQRLPSERELCEQLAVNRSSVREALKRLEQARLIATRQGGGSTVLDYRTHAGFDLLRHLVAPGGELDAKALLGLFEFAAVNWPEIARLAALRAGDDEREELERITMEIEACDPLDAARLQDLDLVLFSLLARASQNIALILVMNSIHGVYEDFRQVFTAAYARVAAHAIPRYRQLSDAVQSGNAAAASRICREHLLALAASVHG